MSPQNKAPNFDFNSNHKTNRNSLQIFHETELGKVIEDSPGTI
jgi:hypothetical protein